MKNYEKYRRELKKYRPGEFCDDYVKPDILKLKRGEECDHDCVRCLVLQMLCLLEEDEESEVDWNKVAVDTPILVRDFTEDRWKARHFAKYENGNVYAWCNGVTSWSTEGHGVMWNYAKLAGSEEE